LRSEWTISKNILINQNFNSFEGFASAAHSWDVDFLQIERGRFEANLVQFISGGLQFAQAFFNRGLDQRGASPEGVWSFAITFSPDMQMSFKGREINGNNSLMIYPPGSEINAISKAGFGVLTFSAPEPFLELLAEKKGLAGFRRQIRHTDVLMCKKRDIETLRLYLIRSLSIIKSKSTQFNGDYRTAGFVNVIPEMVFRSIYHNEAVPHKPTTRLRDGAFKQAMTCIQTHAHEKLSVKSLVHQTGVTERTLEYVFKERLGISPNKYIRIYRLNRVREQLIKSDYSIGIVADIANHWGFWHMGQFAIDYKTQFGELPSDTLKTGLH